MAHIDEMTIVVQRNPAREKPVAGFVPEIPSDPGVEGDTVVDVVFELSEKITDYLNETNPDCKV